MHPSGGSGPTCPDIRVRSARTGGEQPGFALRASRPLAGLGAFITAAPAAALVPVVPDRPSATALQPCRQYLYDFPPSLGSGASGGGAPPAWRATRERE